MSISIAPIAQTPRWIGLKLGSFEAQMNIQALQTGFVPLFVRVRAGEAKDGLKSTRDQLDFTPSPISIAPSACTPMRIWFKFVVFEAYMIDPAWHAGFLPLLVRFEP